MADPMNADRGGLDAERRASEMVDSLTQWSVGSRRDRVDAVAAHMQDRFGAYPQQVEYFAQALREAYAAGVEAAASVVATSAEPPVRRVRENVAREIRTLLIGAAK